ncbi:RICIN domain-containing protein [Demequina sp. SO4-13]|uniref:RICIN domain-containing protein n=1 Tax=Demequina sp. SO4-13 TaxID=3401027 RepID=UPI003AF7C266
MQLSKRFARAAGVSAALASLVGVGLSAAGSDDGSAPLAPSAAEGVATVVVESVHAPGKAATIADATWPLESRSIGADGDAVLSQAIAMHPVEDDTYVLANAEGRVLARIDGERGLEVLDIPVAEAAELPLATWTVTSNGSVSKVVNGAPLDGIDQALDLYDWSTAEGARIATYNDNDFGTNQSWRVHPTVATADAVGGLVSPGEVPELPVSVTGTYGWGASVSLEDIEWEAPSDAVWEEDGIVAFTGTSVGMLGEEVVIDAEYTVGTVGDAVPATLSSYAGVRVEALKLDAPTRVERRVSGSETTVAADVRWDWDAVTTEMLAEPGTVTVQGVAGLGFEATLEIALAEPARSNFLADTNVRGWSFSGTDPEPGLTDGDVDAEGFGDWRSGGAVNRINPNWVAFYFDQPRQLDGAAIHEPAGSNNVGAVTFQYRTMSGGWVDTSVGTLENGGDRLALETDFDPVLATGFRAVFEHKSDASWMRLSELEAWGPVAP